jgi:hypothetical protein
MIDWKRYRRYGISLVISILVVVGLTLTSRWIYQTVTPEEIQTTTTRVNGVALGKPTTSVFLPEQLESSQDMSAVKDWVMECSNVVTLDVLPAGIQKVLSTDPRTVNWTDGPTVKIINRSATRLARLADKINRSRYAEAEWSRIYFIGESLATVLTIGLGLITTIFVALSTSDLVGRQSRLGVSIRIGALLFPAFGTAAAAVISFYNPFANFSRSSQSLLALRQLQNQVATTLWSMPSLDCTAPDNTEQWGSLIKSIAAWEQRYNEIAANLSHFSATSQSGPTTATQIEAATPLPTSERGSPLGANHPVGKQAKNTKPP